MRLVNLNIFGGIVFAPLMKFLNEIKEDVDIFCFQEVFDNKNGVESVLVKGAKGDICKDLALALNDFEGYTSFGQDNERGVATFVKRKVKVKRVEENYVYGKKNQLISADNKTLGVNVLTTALAFEGKEYVVSNFHGLFLMNWGEDSPERIEQSKGLKALLSRLGNRNILCGDFNLAPNTVSMKMLEEGMSNPIRERAIETTRSSISQYGKRVTDYVLLSDSIAVNGFEVIENAVSDHLPLVLDFS